jgi:hypothetical protein
VEWTFLPPSACRHAVRTVSFPITQTLASFRSPALFGRPLASARGSRSERSEEFRVGRIGIWRTVSEDSSGTKSATSGAKALIVSSLAASLKRCPFKASHWPFLLIICAQRIFTRLTKSRSVGYSDFPANSQILLRLAVVNLRTVIVTAAVHWGFSSKLRLAANLSL